MKNLASILLWLQAGGSKTRHTLGESRGFNHAQCSRTAVHPTQPREVIEEQVEAQEWQEPPRLRQRGADVQWLRHAPSQKKQQRMPARQQTDSVTNAATAQLTLGIIPSALHSRQKHTDARFASPENALNKFFGSKNGEKRLAPNKKRYGR